MKSVIGYSITKYTETHYNLSISYMSSVGMTEEDHTIFLDSNETLDDRLRIYFPEVYKIMPSEVASCVQAGKQTALDHDTECKLKDLTKYLVSSGSNVLNQGQKLAVKQYVQCYERMESGNRLNRGYYWTPSIYDQSSMNFIGSEANKSSIDKQMDDEIKKSELIIASLTNESELHRQRELDRNRQLTYQFEMEQRLERIAMQAKNAELERQYYQHKSEMEKRQKQEDERQKEIQKTLKESTFDKIKKFMSRK